MVTISTYCLMYYNNDVLREDLTKLDYITMCIKETLRMYTLVPYIGKLSSEDVVVNGYKIPKSMCIYIARN